MILIKTFGKESDPVSAKIEQNEIHSKFCVQLYHNGKKATWYGWCDSVSTADAWVRMNIDLKSID